MRRFTDIHTHILGGADDGAADYGAMFAMLDMAYLCGTRSVCLTPHFNPRFFGDNNAAVDRAFAVLCAYAADKYPDMKLCLGNELYYSQSGVDDLISGRCRRMNGRKFVLVDFDFEITLFELKGGLYNLLNSGFIPIIAHAERYNCIDGKLSALQEFRDAGIPVQLNAASLLGTWGKKLSRRAWKLLGEGLADIVASDSHNTDDRPPRLDTVSDMITEKFNAGLADLLLRRNPDRILGH